MTLAFHRTYDPKSDITFSATVSGSYDKGATIGANLGVTLNQSQSYSFGSGSSVYIPQGSHKLIPYRPTYRQYKVVENKYQESYIVGYGWHRALVSSKTCYVNVFSHWDFRSIHV